MQELPQTPISPGKEPWRQSSPQRSLPNDHSFTPPPRTPPRTSIPILNQPEVRLHQAPASPVSISPPRRGIQEPETASIREASLHDYDEPSIGRRAVSVPESVQLTGSLQAMAIKPRGSPVNGVARVVQEHSRSRNSSASRSATIEEESESANEPHESLQYHAFDDAPQKPVVRRPNHMASRSIGSSSSGGADLRTSSQLPVPKTNLSRPASAYTLVSEHRGRTLSPLSAEGSGPDSPHSRSRDPSTRRSASRPISYLDLLSNVPYHQQIAPAPLNNISLQSVVGNAASLLDTKKTLDMYRANVKKTTDAAVQYEFAIYMVNASRDLPPGGEIDPLELINEARQILQRLADRAYPFAQYYLGDGYSSGLFNRGRVDHDKAFMLFLAASKHGHAEAGYRAALCYEFGWGTAKSYVKAVNFYRASASKNHPGAATRLGLACVQGDMGLVGREKQREGLKWLKRATEGADGQYNAAPYELAKLHLTGFGSDVFKDEAYAAQLFTQSADLGHPAANFALGQAYENGQWGCPRDAALSVHFYNGAASRGHPEAMMALCAWYMVGAEPVLPKDEGEAYAWARQAAETGFPKAEYAVGYFTEMGIGCRRDPLEANVWYVRAADGGNATARQRLDIIRAAASGEPAVPMTKAEPKSRELRSVSTGVDGVGGGVGGGPSGASAGKKKILGIF